MVPYNAKLIIDVGANAGFSTGLLAEAWPEARVIGIEMNPETANRARENLVEFGDRVEIITSAVGYPDREDVAIFTASSAVDHLKKYKCEEGIEKSINVKSLDTILEDINAIGKIDFMKIDIEGAEIEVLNDGGNWPRQTSVLVLECHSDSLSIEDFKRMVRSLGFVVTDNNPGSIVGQRLDTL
jgi:FkbM family methyltransferase